MTRCQPTLAGVKVFLKHLVAEYTLTGVIPACFKLKSKIVTAMDGAIESPPRWQRSKSVTELEKAPRECCNDAGQSRGTTANLQRCSEKIRHATMPDRLRQAIRFAAYAGITS